jgi:hypothetical protein
MVFRVPLKSLLETAVPAGAVHGVALKIRARLAELRAEVRQLPARPARVRPGEVDAVFAVGDWVLISSARRGGLKDKARCWWEGPCRLAQQVNPRAWQVEDWVTGETLVVHTEHIKPFCNSELRVTPQLREFLAHGGRGFLVDAVVAHRVNSEGKVEVQVQWHGEAEPLTWEPVSSLAVSAKVVLNRYVKSVRDPEQKSLLEDAVASVSR